MKRELKNTGQKDEMQGERIIRIHPSVTKTQGSGFEPCLDRELQVATEASYLPQQALYQED